MCASGVIGLHARGVQLIAPRAEVGLHSLCELPRLRRLVLRRHRRLMRRDRLLPRSGELRARDGCIIARLAQLVAKRIRRGAHVVHLLLHSRELSARPVQLAPSGEVLSRVVGNSSV